MYQTIALYVFCGVVVAYIIHGLHAHDKANNRPFRWGYYLLWLLLIIAIGCIAYGLKTLLGIED